MDWERETIFKFEKVGEKKSTEPSSKRNGFNALMNVNDIIRSFQPYFGPRKKKDFLLFVHLFFFSFLFSIIVITITITISSYRNDQFINFHNSFLSFFLLLYGMQSIGLNHLANGMEYKDRPETLRVIVLYDDWEKLKITHMIRLLLLKSVFELIFFFHFFRFLQHYMIIMWLIKSFIGEN